MNHFLKKQLWLATVVISIVASNAYADDLFDDSFFADPTVTEKKEDAKKDIKPVEPAVATNETVVADDNSNQKKAEDIALPAPEPVANVDIALPAPEPVANVDIELPAPEPEMIALPSTDVVPPPSSMDSFDVPPPAENSFAPTTAPVGIMETPSEELLGGVSSDIFREMAEMERENNSLMLKLKREELRSEIDSLKTANRQVLFDEIERREKMTQARLEWELAQDLKRQDALERKQRAEIRQKQIEAALKREEDRREQVRLQTEERQIKMEKAEEERRIQKAKAEEERRIQKEKQEKLAEERRTAEAKRKYEAASFVKINELKPTLLSITRPVKVKRSLSAEIPKTLTLVGEELLTKKKAGQALVLDSEQAKGGKADQTKKESASVLYVVSEIRGTGGTLIAKLFSKKDKATFFAKKSTILPTGHTVVEIDKDFVLVEIGNEKQIIGFPSAGLLSDEKSKNAENDTGSAPRAMARPRPKAAPVKRAPVGFSGVSMAK